MNGLSRIHIMIPRKNPKGAHWTADALIRPAFFAAFRSLYLQPYSMRKEEAIVGLTDFNYRSCSSFLREGRVTLATAESSRFPTCRTKYWSHRARSQIESLGATDVDPKAIRCIALPPSPMIIERGSHIGAWCRKSRSSAEPPLLSESLSFKPLGCSRRPATVVGSIHTLLLNRSVCMHVFRTPSGRIQHDDRTDNPSS